MIGRGWRSELADRRLCRTLGWVGPTITTTPSELEAGDVIVRAAGRNTYQGRRGWPTATSHPRSDRGQLVIPLDHGQTLRLDPGDRVEPGPHRRDGGQARPPPHHHHHPLTPNTATP